MSDDESKLMEPSRSVALRTIDRETVVSLDDEEQKTSGFGATAPKVCRFRVSGASQDVYKSLLERWPQSLWARLASLAEQNHQVDAEGLPLVMLARNPQRFQLILKALETGELIISEDPVERQLLHDDLLFYQFSELDQLLMFAEGHVLKLSGLSQDSNSQQLIKKDAETSSNQTSRQCPSLQAISKFEAAWGEVLPLPEKKDEQKQKEADPDIKPLQAFPWNLCTRMQGSMSMPVPLLPMDAEIRRHERHQRQLHAQTSYADSPAAKVQTLAVSVSHPSVSIHMFAEPDQQLHYAGLFIARKAEPKKESKTKALVNLPEQKQQPNKLKTEEKQKEDVCKTTLPLPHLREHDLLQLREHDLLQLREHDLLQLREQDVCKPTLPLPPLREEDDGFVRHMGEFQHNWEGVTLNLVRDCLMRSSHWGLPFVAAGGSVVLAMKRRRLYDMASNHYNALKEYCDERKMRPDPVERFAFLSSPRLPSILCPKKTSKSEKKQLGATNTEYQTWQRLFRIHGKECGQVGQRCVVQNKQKKTTSKAWRGTDIDLFIIERNPDVALAALGELYKRLREALPPAWQKRIYILRSAHAVTFIMPPPFANVQVILRLYSSIEHVLIGFDIDSCCAAYDGEQLWVTPRGFRALATKRNLVDPTRQSLTYERRLFKYAKRGFEVGLACLEEMHLNELEHKYDAMLAKLQSGMNVAGLPVNQALSGLDQLLLLFLEAASEVVEKEHERKAEFNVTFRPFLRDILHPSSKRRRLVSSDYSDNTMHLRSLRRQLHSTRLRIREPPSFASGYSLSTVLFSNRCLPPEGSRARLWDKTVVLGNVPSQVSFQTVAAHTQDRTDVIFTGAFHPVSSSWYGKERLLAPPIHLLNIATPD